MKNPQKIQVDRTLFAAAAFVLNGVTRVLGWVLRRDHSVRDENVRVIVLAKLVGLGSLLQSTVLLRSLRARYPQARILYFTLERNAVLCRRLPGVDGVITFDDRTLPRASLTVVRALWALVRARPDLYFDLEVYSHLASILATLSMARNRYGFFRQSCRFKQGLHTHLLYLNCFRHITEAYGQIALLAGAEPDPRLLAPEVRDEERQDADYFLAERGFAGMRFVALNPNASDLLLERRWPAASFAELIERLAGLDAGLAFVLIGAPDEEAYLRTEVLERLPGPVRARTALAAGTLNLFGTIALLQQSAVLVTNDTGPMHFAFALDVPVVTVWGPGLPAHYGPLPGMRAKVVYRDLYCSPCLYHTEPAPCGGDNQCMQCISVDDVLRPTAELLGLEAPPPGPSPVLAAGFVPLGVVTRPEVRE